MRRLFAFCFYGQFGLFLSGGIYQLARELRSLGIEAGTYEYHAKAVQSAMAELDRVVKLGYTPLLYGFSLGVSSITYIQTYRQVALCFAIAASKLGQNYPINKTNTKRSVLWRAPGFLSAAGGGLGFDQVNDIVRPHLMMSFATPVLRSAVAEALKIQEEPVTHDVRWIQASLNTLMNAGLVVDGIQGPLTIAAIENFQRANGLVPDGWAGILTIAAIEAALRLKG